MSETPVYTTRVSVEEAAEQMRRATAEGMRELSEAIGAFNPESEESESSNVLLSESDGSEYKKRTKRRRVVDPCSCGNPSNSKALITGLETRLHFLQLQLTNTLVELDDKELELSATNEWMQTMRKVNNEIGFLRGAVQRGFVADSRYVTAAQLEQRLKLFRDETGEHGQNCLAAINKIDLDEIKQGLTRVLVAERKKLATLDRNYGYQILRTRLLEVGQRLTFYTAIFFAVFAVLYQLYLSW